MKTPFVIYTVYSGHNDSGYNDFRNIRHVFLGPNGCFSFIFTPDITIFATSDIIFSVPCDVVISGVHCTS